MRYGDIVFSFVVQLKCQNCGMYLRKQKCPPYTPKYFKVQNLLKRYNFFTLLIKRVDSSPWYEKLVERGLTSEFRKRYYSGCTTNMIAKTHVDKAVLRYRDFLSSHGIKVFPLGSGGGCRKCRKCSVLTHEPCRYPSEAFPSPEACGIDLYTTLRNIGERIETPPMQVYTTVAMICASIPDYTFIPKQREFYKHQKPHVEPITSQAINVYNPLGIYDPTIDCGCDKYSDFLCDKSLYLEEDLRLWLRDKKLYVFQLEKDVSTLKGIMEAHNRFTLPLGRAGAWWEFTLTHTRCPNPKCSVCTKEQHFEHGWKSVSNRRIMRCVKYFNLYPEESGENIVYVLM